MQLRVVAPLAALGGALVASVALVVFAGPGGAPEVMPPASPGLSAGTPMDGVEVDHPPPPSLPVGAVAAGYGSTRTSSAGVPAGFARSPDGAAAAATAWLATVEGAGVLDGRRRRAVLEAVGDAGFVTAAADRLADRSAALGLDAAGRPGAGYLAATVWAVRGAYRVVSYGPGVARVEVWHLYQLEVVPPGARPGPGRWRRATAALRWDDGAKDWRLRSDFRFVDGPDPQVAAPSRLERAAVLARVGDGWRLYANTQD